MRAIGIGDDQLRAFAHGVRGGGNSREIELAVAAEQDHVAAGFDQLHAEPARVGAQHRARQQHDPRAGHFARHQVDRGGAGQHDPLGRDVQVHRAQ